MAGCIPPWCLVCGTPLFWQQCKNTVLHLCLCVWLTAYCDYNLTLVQRMEVRALSLGQDVRCWKPARNKCLVLWNIPAPAPDLTWPGIYRLYLASLVWCKRYSVISKWGICGRVCVLSGLSLSLSHRMWDLSQFINPTHAFMLSYLHN